MRAGDHDALLRCRHARDHAGAVVGARLTALSRGARPVEQVECHVVGIRPDAHLRVVGEAVPRCILCRSLKCVAVPASGGVARCRYGDALEVWKGAGDGKLLCHPASAHRVVDDHAVAVVVGLTAAAEAGPQRARLLRGEQRSAGLAVDGQVEVDELHVLRGSGRTIAVGRQDGVEIANASEVGVR